MAAVAECNQQSYNFQPLCMTNFYAMDSDSTLTMTQLNAFHDDDGDSNRLPLQNRATKNSSDTFVERYKSELRCLQNPVNKWMTSHPEHWRSCEVIDWLYYCAHLNSIDCRVFKAEAFQDKLGQDLCLMNEGQFQELDPIYGKQIFDTFQRFLHTSSFVPSVCYIVHRDVRHTDPFGLVWGLVFAVARLVILCFCTRNKWIIQEDERNLELTFSNDPVNISSENSYTDLISVDNFSVLESHNTGNQTILNQNKNAATGKWGSHVSTHVSYMHTHIPEATSCTNIYDSTGSESVQGSTSSGESSPQYCQPYNLASTPRVYCSSLPTDPAYHTTSLEEVPIPTDDKSCAMATNLTVVSERKQTRGRRSGHGSKGTHLWEFIRDLLHDDKFCPGLIKWEDPDMGVFRFVQSEAVAKMWGQKKNNTSMTYEKLSRAMRFCRGAGYFDSLPKKSGFPKKLCFKFGPKSYGWRKT